MAKKILYWTDVVVCLGKHAKYLAEDGYSKIHVTCRGCAKEELCRSIREVISEDRAKSVEQKRIKRNEAMQNRR